MQIWVVLPILNPSQSNSVFRDLQDNLFDLDNNKVLLSEIYRIFNKTLFG